MSDIAVVIRSVGERTENACAEIARSQVPSADVAVIHERPFGAAVRKTFQLGIEMNRHWTLAVDADVLLRENAIQDILAWTQNYKGSFFFANFSIIDKLRGNIFPGGAHLYPTNLLEQGLSLAGNDIDSNARPESLVRSRMQMQGHDTLQLSNLIVGLHDFEQSYRDIYRTAFVHRLKHPAWMIEPCLTAWTRLSGSDPDFAVALQGVSAADAEGGKAIIDDRQFPESLDDVIGLPEKPSLAADAVSGKDVALQIGRFAPFPECTECEVMLWNAQNTIKTSSTPYQRAKALYKQTGILRFPFLVLGAGLERSGQSLVRWAKRD